METILQERDGAVLRLILNRPDVLNAFHLAMARELQDALRTAHDDASVRCVVLTGAGRAFCAGQDLASVSLDTDPPPDLGDFVREQYNPIIRLIRELPKPVIGAVNGVAAGAGANLALACDIVVAAESASFIQSFTKIGLVPDSGGSFFLPRLVGSARATALLMLGDKLTATDAASWGLIWRAVPADALAGEVATLATRLAAMPTRALALTKEALNASTVNDCSRQLDVEERLQREAGNSADFHEGVRAFLEKRPPTFLGR